jgi:hypothetical protein
MPFTPIVGKDSNITLSSLGCLLASNGFPLFPFSLLNRYLSTLLLCFALSLNFNSYLCAKTNI